MSFADDDGGEAKEDPGISDCEVIAVAVEGRGKVTARRRLRVLSEKLGLVKKTDVPPEFNGAVKFCRAHEAHVRSGASSLIMDQDVVDVMDKWSVAAQKAADDDDPSQKAASLVHKARTYASDLRAMREEVTKSREQRRADADYYTAKVVKVKKLVQGVAAEDARRCQRLARLRAKCEARQEPPPGKYAHPWYEESDLSVALRHESLKFKLERNEEKALSAVEAYAAANTYAVDVSAANAPLYELTEARKALEENASSKARLQDVSVVEDRSARESDEDSQDTNEDF
ncbi:hypothetical protein M885DRAFT_626816 [Pelagophyceae sp. CCMP2097]|nr:hypothetical protein M885DRAFT_626816 [Pelagophyceae sp. CCMP2097]